METVTSKYPPVGSCTICGETDTKLCLCLSLWAENPSPSPYRGQLKYAPKEKMGLKNQLDWWYESFCYPMMRYIVQSQTDSPTIEIYLNTHVNRHLTGYPKEFENSFYLPILPEWVEIEDKPLPMLAYLVDFFKDLLDEIESHNGIEKPVRVVHYVQSVISSVRSIDLALAASTKMAGDRFRNWEFYDRNYDAPKKIYLPEHPSFGPLIVDQLEELMLIRKTKRDYTVVIDGANFIRDNAEFSFVPEKLHQVLRFIEKRGGRPVALLSKTTYPKMKKELKGDRFRHLLIQFDRRIAEGSIQLVAENDDLRCIQRALEWDVILLSQDQWAAERKRFASYDWSRLDELQISKYDSTRNAFSSKKLLDYLEESFHLRLHQLIAESCGREGGCDKTSIMEKMAVEFLPGNTFVREQHGWVKDLRAIVNLLGDGNKMTLANWITKNLPETFQERDGQIMPVNK